MARRCCVIGHIDPLAIACAEEIAALDPAVVYLVCVYLVYVVSPFDLAWHLSTSMSRLFTQWLPSLLLLWCLWLNTP